MSTDRNAKTREVDETRRRIDHWRETRRHRNVPMPTALWAAAVTAAREHGLYTTARRLHVDYGALRRHVAAANEVGRSAAHPTFIEVAAGPACGSTRGAACVIEIDATSGTRRLHLQGLAPADVLTLARMAWSAAE